MSKDKAYKPKIIAIEIGDAMFDAKVRDGLKAIPKEQNEMKKFLLSYSSPVFEEFERLYQSSAPLEQTARNNLITMIEAQLQNYSEKDRAYFKERAAEPESSNSAIGTHLECMKKSLEQNESLDEIAGSLKRRFEGQFDKDFERLYITIMIDGEEKKLNLSRNGSMREQLKEALPFISDEQLQYIISEDNQRSNRGVVNAFINDGSTNISEGKDQKTIFHVKTLKNGERKLEGIEYQRIGTSFSYQPDGNVENRQDSEVGLYVDLSKLTGNKQAGEKELLPIPSKKPLKILTYKPLHEEAEYSLPDCLKNRTLDKVLAKAIENGDLDKVTFLTSNKIGHKALEKILNKAIDERDLAKVTFISNIPDIDQSLSAKTKTLRDLCVHDQKAIEAQGDRDRLLGGLIDSYSSSKTKTNSFEEAGRFTKRMFEYFGGDIENMSPNTLNKFLQCKNAIQSYLNKSSDLDNAIAQVQVMEVAINLDKKALKEKEPLERTSSLVSIDSQETGSRGSGADSPVSISGADRDKSLNRFANAIRKKQEERKVAEGVQILPKVNSIDNTQGR